uniref:Dynein heavy chain AAA module D4 domain-containing protein n=1 Tax=Callorhinchus milii TaxID=7868 RepID=A0A4W3H4H4_CALMI
MMLIGIGGSGRQSLSRIASSICDYIVFQIEVTRIYRKQEFREDIKRLYRQAGVENKPTVFLFNDTQIVHESFLEDVNNILSSGEVPNLYKADEFEEVSERACGHTTTTAPLTWGSTPGRLTVAESDPRAREREVTVSTIEKEGLQAAFEGGEGGGEAEGESDRVSGRSGRRHGHRWWSGTGA